MRGSDADAWTGLSEEGRVFIAIAHNNRNNSRLSWTQNKLQQQSSLVSLSVPSLLPIPKIFGALILDLWPPSGQSGDTDCRPFHRDQLTPGLPLSVCRLGHLCYEQNSPCFSGEIICVSILIVFSVLTLSSSSSSSFIFFFLDGRGWDYHVNF